MPSPAFPGMFFCFAAFVLLIIATISAPIWNSVYFLQATVNGVTVNFGVFGYTGIPQRTLGYSITPETFGVDDDSLNAAVIKGLTSVMILHPIAAAFAGIAFIFGFCGSEGYSRICTIIMSLAAALATLVTLVVWVIDMILWGIARDRIIDNGPPGSTASYGNANWMVLGAFVALLLGFCAGICGSFGRFHTFSRRGGAAKV